MLGSFKNVLLSSKAAMQKMIVTKTPQVSHKNKTTYSCPSIFYYVRGEQSQYLLLYKNRLNALECTAQVSVVIKSKITKKCTKLMK